MQQATKYEKLIKYLPYYNQECEITTINIANEDYLIQSLWIKQKKIINKVISLEVGLSPSKKKKKLFSLLQ